MRHGFDEAASQQTIGPGYRLIGIQASGSHRGESVRCPIVSPQQARSLQPYRKLFLSFRSDSTGDLRRRNCFLSTIVTETDMRNHTTRQILGRFLLLFMLAVVPATLAAQPGTSSTPDEPVTTSESVAPYYGIGLYGSLLSGAGLSGRMVLADRFTIQLTTFVFANSSLTHFNAGLEGQYNFAKGSVGRLYGLGGFGYYLSTSSDSLKPGNRVAEPFRTGLGVGGDLLLADNFAVDGALAFHWFVATGKVLPLPTFGFHYYFR